jgi:ubiquinone/menaquinone biosynthesis C-methylase UbiE
MTSENIIENVVIKVKKEVDAHNFDLSSGPLRLRSKLYWLKIIDVVQPVTLLHTDYGLILDVGCGLGHFSAILSHLGFQSIGIDLHHNNSWNYFKKHRRCQFVKADGLCLPLKEKLFDCVGAFAVLEHVADEPSFLDEIYRVLKPQGTLCISQLPSAVSFNEILQISKLFPEIKDHEKKYKKHQFSHLLRDSGFKVISIRMDHFLPFIVPFTSMRRSWNQVTRLLYTLDKILSILPVSHSFNIIAQKQI